MTTKAEKKPLEDPGDLDSVWKALANRDRRRMLDLLVDGAMTTGELAEQFEGLSRFAVMQHLKVLEHADLIVVRRSGRLRYNHLNPVPIQQVSDRWISRYQRPFAEALVDLKTSVESGERDEHVESTRAASA